MRPRIDTTRYGSITVEGHTYQHDLLVRPGGQVEARAKELSKAVYGTSHRISLAEAKQVYQEGADRLIVGTGFTGLTRLSEEAAAYLAEQGCRVDRYRTRRAIRAWNRAEGTVIGLFHITC
jgi:hypothetical protein